MDKTPARAGRDAQLVVIGQPGDGPHLELASVLARTCPCPVLTIAGETVAAV
jgi:hypothetical protein